MLANLLSDDIVIMAGLDLEAAVVGPEVDGTGDAGDSAFVDLDVHVQREVSCMRTQCISPSLPIQCLQWQIPCRHISSSTRKRGESERGSGRRHRGWRRWRRG